MSDEKTTTNNDNDYVVEQTIWGYIIHPGEPALKRAAIGEIAAILACIIFGVFAYCQWLLPGTINTVDVLPFKLAGTIMFLVLGMLCYGIARRGLTLETQVDQRRAELRVVYRNREGGSSLVERYDFDAVNSVFIQRGRGPLAMNRLFVDHNNASKPILVAKGSAKCLEAIQERMSADMRYETLSDMRRAEARKKNSRSHLMAAE